MQIYVFLLKDQIKSSKISTISSPRRRGCHNDVCHFACRGVASALPKESLFDAEVPF